MALEFVDGFDSYGTTAGSAAEGIVRWDAGLNTLPTATGRYGGNAATSSSLTKVLPTAVTRTVGAAFKFGTSFSVGNIIVLRDVTTVQLAIRVNATGTLSLMRGSTAIATSTPTVFVNTWYYIELQGTVDPTSGYAEIRVNGRTWSTFSGNTRNTANSYSNSLMVSIPANGGLFDDVYSRNDSTWMGEISIGTDMPNAEGDTIQWTPNSASIHWNRVAEIPYDSDTTYNSSSTVGNIDLYKFPSRTIVASSVLAAVVCTPIERTDGTNSSAEQCKSGGTVYTGATNSMTTAYKGYMEIHEVDPATSAAWTNANLNLAQFGVKVIS